jgi:prepilin-type processing-associated H-X9-DG protein
MLAIHNYADFKGKPMSNPSPDPVAPDERVFPTGCIGSGNTPEERLSWIVAVLPYMDQESLYRQIRVEKGYAENLSAAQKKINSLICPSAKNVPDDPAVTTYVAMAGVGSDAAARPAGAVGIGFMGFDRRTTEKIIADGVANTIALMETRSGLGPCARGGSSNLRGFKSADVPLFGDNQQFGEHESRAHAAFADGSVRPFAVLIEPGKLAAAITIAGGEGPVNLD